MKDENRFEGIHEEVVDELYHQYEIDHDMAFTRYIHPMFRNGTFSRDNSYQPEDPGELLSKEEFAKRFEIHGSDDKWSIGYEVLFSYIARLRRRAAAQPDQVKQL